MRAADVALEQVWVGTRDHQSLGTGESGARTALVDVLVAAGDDEVPLFPTGDED